jgi:plasmid stabilization system protein ParE
MNLKRTRQYTTQLQNILRYIHKDKPSAAVNFKKDLDAKLYQMLENPYMYRVSVYADDENVRDMVFKGYTVVYEIDGNIIIVLDIFKWIGRVFYDDIWTLDKFEKLKNSGRFSDREFMVACLKYHRCLSDSQIAENIGFTEARVKQLLSSINNKIKQI